MHLLLVDDDALLRELLDEALSGHYRVTAVGSVHAATPHLAKDGDAGLHVILLDCSLPAETSMELARAADRLGIPVVLMSGYPDVHLWPDADGRPFLAKPFTPTQALALLATVLATPAG
jgi:DNA-binding NtrC family response regulator